MALAVCPERVTRLYSPALTRRFANPGVRSCWTRDRQPGAALDDDERRVDDHEGRGTWDVDQMRPGWVTCCPISS